MCRAAPNNVHMRAPFSVFVTTNEGDGREYGEEGTPGFYTDETRVADLAVELGLDPTLPPYTDDTLGRLVVREETP